TVRLRDIANLFDDPVEQRPSEFRMGYLAAAKRNRELNTLAVGYKASDVGNLELDVVSAGQRAHLYFLDCAGRRTALGIMSLFLLRVTILVVVGDAADRRRRGGRHFDQVEATAFRHLDCIAKGQHSHLAAICINHADLLRTDQVVDPDGRFPRWRSTKISTDKPPPSALRPRIKLARYARWGHGSRAWR